MAAVELEHVHNDESFIVVICSRGKASVTSSVVFNVLVLGPPVRITR